VFGKLPRWEVSSGHHGIMVMASYPTVQTNAQISAKIANMSYGLSYLLTDPVGKKKLLKGY